MHVIVHQQDIESSNSNLMRAIQARFDVHYKEALAVSSIQVPAVARSTAIDKIKLMVAAEFEGALFGFNKYALGLPDQEAQRRAITVSRQLASNVTEFTARHGWQPTVFGGTAEVGTYDLLGEFAMAKLRRTNEFMEQVCCDHKDLLVAAHLMVINEEDITKMTMAQFWKRAQEISREPENAALLKPIDPKKYRALGNMYEDIAQRTLGSLDPRELNSLLGINATYGKWEDLRALYELAWSGTKK